TEFVGIPHFKPVRKGVKWWVVQGLMHMLAKEKMNVRAGFVHIPFLLEQASFHQGQPSMSLTTITEGMELLIETALEVKEDIIEIGGATH
ncbi:hypothetical protein BAMA_20085, partial [Bacillus manliponensis]